MTTDTGTGRNRLFEFINRRIVLVSVIVAVLAIVMAGVFDAIGSTDEPEYDPSGAIYDTQQLVEDTFSFTEGTRSAAFLVEGIDGGDVLTRDGLLEWKSNSAALRADTTVFRDDPINSHLVTEFDTDSGYTVDGVFSLADAVDQELTGGLEAATDADVKVALSTLLAGDAPTAGLRTTLSRLATAIPGEVAGQNIEVWESPAFRAEVRYDLDSFEVTTSSTDPDVVDFERFLEVQRWLREAQVVLRGDQQNMTALGLGIDIDLEFEDQAAEASPFILGAVVVILIVVGGLLRSYWAAAYVGLGLVVTMLIYKGIFALVGLKGGLLLGFIVPVSIISFGVDFFIHASGRAREAQLRGASRDRAYPIGMSTVILALTLAAVSSAAAFASNAVSGIEAITQFGIGAAIAILVAYVVLGMIAPKLLLATEEALGPRPARRHHLRLGTRLGFLLSTLVAGAIVAAGTQFSTAGAIGGIVFALLFIYLPFRWTRRRNTRAKAAGKKMTDEVKGVGHGLRSAGYVVHFLARWRVVTIPVVVLLAIAGVVGALEVKSEFQFSDFLASDSDAVRGIEKSELHFGNIGGTGYIYVEGDLTEPATLEAMEGALNEVVTSGVQLSRDFDGEVQVGDNAATLARFAVASSAAAQDIEAATGVAITDGDGNGLPDTSEQVAAVYTQATKAGLRNDGGQMVFSPGTVAAILAVNGSTQATRLEALIGTFTDGPLIDAAAGAFNDAAANLEASPAGASLDVVSVSGDSITTRNTLDAFTKSMLVSLPLALLLTFLLASFIMKSIKYAAVSVVPILLVVAWVYGFMYLVGYSINPVTSTIAAISIGVGIDFATHFTVRFREELVGEASRFPALRRAGEGTGGALVISALTSIAGFGVLGLAPMPIFAVYGVLTAVMIALAVLVSLLVLPSLLLFVTPSLKGDDRAALEQELTGGRWVYEPHRRETALRG
ncbi:MAG: MMPL family transporter [Acidimicrobiia bacterium]|nr:MMPL family transporter [Acidimicrobiia bacterium]